MSRVLIIDDDPDIRSLTELILSLAGHSTLNAGDGASALKIIATDPDIDVMLLDLRLPDLGGWELLERLRGRPRPSVIIFSAQIGPIDQALARDFGAAGYLRKPFNEQELLDAVDLAARLPGLSRD